MNQQAGSAHPQGVRDAESGTGVLLVNLGTPEAPTAQALRPYLRQFLSNPRVVEIPSWIWWPILNGAILPTRPAKSAEKYAQIWMPEGSPLKVHTERQTRLLRDAMAARTPFPPIIEYAMSIGSPSIAQILESMLRQGCDRILVVPLYPQYAASSTAAIFDAVFGYLGGLRDVPALRTVRHYPDHPGYIAALAQNVRDHWAESGRPDKLLISFHGIPRAAVDKGDPYPEDCRITGCLLARALELGEDDYLISFQSRFGRAEWLTPYTAATLEQLGRQGVRRVDVVCPGFVSDCLETLEEIAMEGRDIFLRAGGQAYHPIPCLNERHDWIQVLADIVCTHLQGWEAAKVERKN